MHMHLVTSIKYARIEMECLRYENQNDYQDNDINNNSFTKENVQKYRNAYLCSIRNGCCFCTYKHDFELKLALFFLQNKINNLLIVLLFCIIHNNNDDNI